MAAVAQAGQQCCAQGGARDVLRILLGVPTERLPRAFGALVQHEVAQVVTRETLARLRKRFASVRASTRRWQCALPGRWLLLTPSPNPASC